MAFRTMEMRFIELLVMKQDMARVISYLGKEGIFQFHTNENFSIVKNSISENANDENFDSKKIGERFLQNNNIDSGSGVDNFLAENFDKKTFMALEEARGFLGFADNDENAPIADLPTAEQKESAAKILYEIQSLKNRFATLSDEIKRVDDTYREALSFSNLKISYSQLASLSFLAFRIGRIEPDVFEKLQEEVGERAIIIRLGEDSSRILAACPRKARFALDTALKNFGFVETEISPEFKGIPDEMLNGMQKRQADLKKEFAKIEAEKKSFAQKNCQEILSLLRAFSVGMQTFEQMKKFEMTSMTCRITGWVAKNNVKKIEKDLIAVASEKISMRQFLPSELPAVISGREQVPVSLHHGKFVKSFQRMIFSYGAPVYGTIDPTPFVSIFFTLLFGIMFGDLGQGLIFLLAGILLAKGVVKLDGWNKFAPIFIAIGISSSVMGLLTGEFFATEKILEPFALWLTGLFGEAHHPIIKMMPSSDPSSIKVMFSVFGVAVFAGFVINTCGLIINLANKLFQKKIGNFLFGKTGLAGAAFFWYVVILAVRVAFFGHAISTVDFIIIFATLFFAAFGEPFERLIDGKRPIIENGFLACVIGGVVELIEVLSSYLSNTVSFLRVGAFALAHAVLGFIILTMSEIATPGLNVLVLVLGNAIVIVLEGMIVAIQVIRLQYYEFFSKFFTETGKEFKPFVFEYAKS